MSVKPEEIVVDTAPDTEPGVDLGSLLRAPLWRARVAAAAVVLGKIVSVEADGVVSVQLPGAEGARAARLAAPLSQDDLIAALQASRAVVLTFENADPELPIIIGIIQPPIAEQAAETARAASDNTRPTVEEESAVIEANVDGKRVRIVAQDEIVLECGSASITLRRNGRVVVRGTYVETYSEGTNRIKGGQVRIN